MENSLSKARRRRIELRDAVAELESALSGAASGEGWRDAVRTSTAGLRAAIDAHVSEVEAPDGLLAEIVDDAPRLSNEVELIKREHARMLVDTDVILSDLDEAEPRDIRARAMDLLRDIVAHRQRGSDLVWEAYDTDIGGQG